MYVPRRCCYPTLSYLWNKFNLYFAVAAAAAEMRAVAVADEISNFKLDFQMFRNHPAGAEAVESEFDFLY